jgi:hypothetical protein
MAVLNGEPSHAQSGEVAAKHTPGPWDVSEVRPLTDRGETYMVLGGGFDFGLVADVTLEPDARLIAAAPDLLEAAQNALGLLDTPLARRRHAEDPFFEAVVASLREAHAKATGEA